MGENTETKLVQKFHPGDAVILKGNIMGSILNGYLWTCMDAKEYLYRVIVDANDCVYRVFNNSIDQTKDAEIFAEDYDTLMWTTQQVAIMEVFEKDITKYER